MGTVETKKIIVKKKDSLWNITKAQGFPAKDWKKIYNASYNYKLRKERPNPDLIHPGDSLYVPVNTPKEIKRRLDAMKRSGNKLAVLVKKSAALEKEIMRLTDYIDGEKAKSAKQIGKLRAQHEQLYEEQLDIIDNMGGPPDPYGGVAYAKLFEERSAEMRTIRKKVAFIEALIKAKKEVNRKLVHELLVDQKKLNKNLSKATKEFGKSISSHAKALQNPY